MQFFSDIRMKKSALYFVLIKVCKFYLDLIMKLYEIVFFINPNTGLL
jgi:hypothetical protein